MDWHVALSAAVQLALQNVFSYYRMCSLTIDVAHSAVVQLALKNVFSYDRMCSLDYSAVVQLALAVSRV